MQYAAFHSDSLPLRKDPSSHWDNLNLWESGDSTILMALSEVAAQQAKTMDETMAQVKHFLEYFAMHEDAVITYRKSDTILAVHSKADIQICMIPITEPVAIFTCPMMWSFPQTMEQYSTFHV